VGCVIQAAVLDVPCTQSQEVHFQSSAWKAMREDLGAQAELILTDFCINSIIQKVGKSQQGLNYRIVELEDD